MKAKIRALKKLYFFEEKEVRYIQPGEYAEIEDKLLNKFLKLKAVEVIAAGEEIKNFSNNDSLIETEETALPDIVEVVEKMDSIKEKTTLISYANSLGVQNLTKEMSIEEIKAAVVNGLENTNDI